MRALCFLWVIQGFAAFNLTWGNPAMELHPLVNDIDGNAAIATDPMGNAIATWSRTTGKGASEDVWAASYNHSLRVWTGAVKISGGGSAANSRVAVDADGNAILVWDEGFPTQIMSRTLSAQGIWTPELSSPPIPIHTCKNGQISPQVGIDALGNAVVIWMEYFRNSYHIKSAKKNLGLPWVFLGEISPGLLTTPKALAISDSGDAIAVWEEADSEIHGARYVNGSWLAPLTIATGEAKFPSAGIDASGNSVIVWSEANEVRSKSLIDGVLSPETLIASNPAYMALHPDVGVDAAGNAVVVFERYNAIHKFVAAAQLPFGAAAWSTPLDISGPSPASASNAGRPILSLNGIGDGVAIWKEFGETQMTIQGAGYALGTWSPGKILSSLKDSSGGLLPTYAVSVNLTGNIGAVWPEAPTEEAPPQIKAALEPSVPAYAVSVNLTGDIGAVWPEAPTEEAPPQIKATPEPSVPAYAVSVNLTGNIMAVWPEAPTEGAPPQIKATSGVGLATIGPLPPVVDPVSLTIDIIGVASGTQIRHRFPAHTDYINILSWGSPGDVAYYKIYRNDFSTLIGTSRAPRYEDHQRIPKKRETYLITSVGKNGQESSPITLIVYPR